MWTDPGNIKIAHRHMSVEIGAEAALFPDKEYINGIAVAVKTPLDCTLYRQYEQLAPDFLSRETLSLTV